jgi:hypothetical protein
LIYVEQNERRVQAIVQFFGSFQFAVMLAVDAPALLPHANLATLDIRTGQSSYRRLDPLLLPVFVASPRNTLTPVAKLNA